MINADAEWGDSPPATMLTTLVRNAGIRMRPMNRAQPRAGHWVFDCTTCSGTDAIWIEPAGNYLETTCGCWQGRGDAFAMLHLLRGGQ